MSERHPIWPAATVIVDAETRVRHVPAESDYGDEPSRPPLVNVTRPGLFLCIIVDWN